MKEDKLFGTYIRMHRVSKNIKLEVMADYVKLNKGKLSKLETGSLSWSDEDKKKVLSYLKIQFYETLHRENFQNQILEIYEKYAKLDEDSMHNDMKRIVDNRNLKYSICFIEYYLLQYMNILLVLKNTSYLESLKHNMQMVMPYFSKIERLLYYDMLGLELYYKQQYEEAVEYF